MAKWTPVLEDKDDIGVDKYLARDCNVSEDELGEWFFHEYKERENKWGKEIAPFVAAKEDMLSELEKKLDDLECRDRDEIDDKVKRYGLGVENGAIVGFKINRIAYGQCT